MNPFPSIQQAAADAIVAAAAFASITVLNDDGTQEQAIETALASNGVCVLVGMPVGFDATQNAHKTVHGEVTFTVELFFNPEKNATLATPRNVVELIGDLVLALVSTPVLQARNHATVEGFDVVRNEPGLIVFSVELKRPATVTQ